MPVMLTPEPTATSEGPPRKKWTREECGVLASAGIDLTHYELVEGELILTMGKKRAHSNVLRRLVILLGHLFGEEFVQHEVSLDVSPEDNPTSEPEPDAVVLRRSFSELADGNPRPGDVALVVEVADTTLRFDRTVKAGLYARAGLAEYWVVDTVGERVYVHRDALEGVYQSVVEFGREESVSPLAKPEGAIRVESLFS